MRPGYRFRVISLAIYLVAVFWYAWFGGGLFR